MPYAQNARGERLYYQIVGDRGPHVVLLMGIGVSGRFWFHVPEALAGDPEHPARVVVIDNVGTGRSDRPRFPFSMASMADDVAAVLDEAGIAHAQVVGISMGGMIAQHVALRHAERVSGLVLLSTMPGLPFGKLPQPSAIEALVRGFKNGLKGETFMRLMYPEHQLAVARERLRNGAWKQTVRAEGVDMRTFGFHLLAVASHSTGHRLSRIACPTVVVTGSHDLLIPPENAKRMAKAIPRASLYVIPDTGHDVLTLAPTAVSDSLRMLGPAGALRV